MASRLLKEGVDVRPPLVKKNRIEAGYDEVEYLASPMAVTA